MDSNKSTRSTSRQFLAVLVGLLVGSLPLTGCRSSTTGGARDGSLLSRLIAPAPEFELTTQEHDPISTKLRPGSIGRTATAESRYQAKDDIDPAFAQSDDEEFDAALEEATPEIKSMLQRTRDALAGRRLQRNSSSSTSKSLEEAEHDRVAQKLADDGSDELTMKGVSFSLSDEINEIVDSASMEEAKASPVAEENVIAVATKSQPPSASQGIDDEKSEVQAASFSAGPAKSLPVETEGVEPATPEAAMSWQDHIRAALHQLDRETISNETTNPEELLYRSATIRMLNLTLGDMEKAQEPIEGLSPHEQDYFRYDFQALYDAITPGSNPVLNRRWTLALQSQRQALSHLAAVSNLEVNNTSFCTVVDGFGVTTRFPQYHFRPDQEVLLYCELDNFVSEPVKDGFETQLRGSYQIVDAGGQRVADQSLPMEAHVCRNQRRDYFIAYRIYMPQQIEPGRYQLRLTLEDMKGRKFGQSNVDFQIVQ